MNRVQVLAVVLVVGWASPLYGTTINSNTIISAENSFPGETVIIVDGESPPTVVQMIDGGEAQSIALSGESILNFDGGNVTEYISAASASTVNVRGGSMRSLIVRDSSIGNIFGGIIESGVGIGTGLGSLATLNIFGGDIRGNVGPDARGGILNIHGGRMGSIFSTILVDSTINVTGGSLFSLNLHGGKTVHWSGGELRDEYALLQDDTILNVYGRDLEFNYPLLSGALLDGTVLADYYIDRRDNSQVILHNVPEPQSLGLAVMMVAPLLIRRGADRLKPFLAPRLLALALLAGFATPVGAVTIDYDTIISAENSFPGKFVNIFDGESSPSVVQMIEGGEATQINVLDHSIFNLLGGKIEAGLHARGNSQVNILHGTTGTFTVRDNAVGNVFGGTIESGVGIGTGLGSLATLNIFGGEILGNVSPDAIGGVLNVHGGWMRSIFSKGSSTINVTGGSLLSFNLSGSHTVHWSGGELREKYALLRDDTSLNVYGRDLAFNYPFLSGELLDGTFLDDYYIDRMNNSQVILHNVPEPAALGLGLVAVVAVLVCGGAGRRG